MQTAVQGLNKSLSFFLEKANSLLLKMSIALLSSMNPTRTRCGSVPEQAHFQASFISQVFLFKKVAVSVPLQVNFL